jgi:hypothetical protein
MRSRRTWRDYRSRRHDPPSSDDLYLIADEAGVDLDQARLSRRSDVLAGTPTTWEACEAMGIDPETGRCLQGGSGDLDD